jgi:putative PIN family toxin of toxin-antitoxin system
VIDTNVFVSAALTPGGIYDQVLQCAVAGLFVPVWDNQILSEYREVLARPKFRLSKTAVRALLDALPASGFRRGMSLKEVCLPDPDDLPFVAVALAAPDKTIITGNPRHYPEIEMQKLGVKILSPRGCMTKKWGFKLLLPRSLRNDLISDNSARR